MTDQHADSAAQPGASPKTASPNPGPATPPPSGGRARWLLLCLVIGAVVFGGGYWYYHRPAAVPAPEAAAAPPALPVTVSKPLKTQVTEWDEFTGQFEAVDSVEIRARVSGYLDTIGFEDGQIVNKGDLLFVIDPRPFQI